MTKANPGLAGKTFACTPRLAFREFDLLRTTVRDECGIQLNDCKMTLVQNRVGKRLRALGFSSFRQYCDYLSSGAGRCTELIHLCSAITTNQTYFFREEHHFALVANDLLPQIVLSAPLPRKIMVWSAGCSTGQEPYSLAMVLDDHLRPLAGWRFSIFASDLNVDALEQAAAGAYEISAAREIPREYLARYVDCYEDRIEIKNELRRHVRFEAGNLTTTTIPETKNDLIFCRNSLMYLHREAREKVIELFYRSLASGGALVVGSSESLRGLNHRFEIERLSKTIFYRKVRREEPQV